MDFLNSGKLSLACAILNYILAIIYFYQGDALYFLISLALGVLCHRNYLISEE
jgi:hypothetical protein